MCLLLVAACGPTRKLQSIRSKQMSADIKLPPSRSYVPEQRDISTPKRDTLKVTGLNGEELFVMRAVKDSSTGEMIASEQLQAAVIEARFSNVAERKGQVELEFLVSVPREMQDSKWQLRLHPDMFILSDSVRLDDVIITGADYRKAQLRGYEQYNRFLRRIITDTTLLVDERNLEIFIRRNIPQLYAFKSDSSIVSDEAFITCFGVSERDAIEHYTRRFLVARNAYLRSRRSKMYARYVKSPIVTSGIRLDTVLTTDAGDFKYYYKQTISTRSKLRKVDIILSGEIFEQDEQLYTIPQSSPLSFYISSVSAFTDRTPKYLTRIVSRHADASMESHIDFPAGKSSIDESYGRSATEIAAIKRVLRDLLSNTTYDLDSVRIIASASPEGAQRSNNRLAELRAKAVSDYFEDYINRYIDSLQRYAGFSVVLNEEGREQILEAPAIAPTRIDFRSHSGGENWTMLDDLISADTLLTEQQKYRYFASRSELNPDTREAALRKEAFYGYLLRSLYPSLRTVKLHFSLHRKDIIQDTVYTTVLDSAYMRGVQMLSDREYSSALQILTPYADINTAIAYVALGHNHSALPILLSLEKSRAEVNYLLAIIYARLGNEQKAVDHYLRSCEQNGSFIYRGNLDPEISSLIEQFGLNRDPSLEDL